MERTPEVKKFIEDHQELFWYSPAPKSETVSDELLVDENEMKAFLIDVALEGFG